MERADRCHICDLHHPGLESSSFCFTCRTNDERRRYCIAFAEHDSLKPFLAADDEGSMRSCSRRLADQGHPCVMLEWNDEHAHYRVI